jgi:hypothetical protein
MVAPMVENLLSKYEALSLDPNNGRGSKRAGGEHLPRKLKALSSTPVPPSKRKIQIRLHP